MPTASTRLRDVQELTSPYKSLHDNYVSNTRKSKCSSSALLATGGLIVLGVLLAIVVIEKLKNEDQINEDLSPHHHTPTCCNDTIPNEQSSIVLVESFPLGMDYGRNASAGKSLYDAWKHLLSLATKEIAVASFYWSLTAEDINMNSTTDRAGRDILEEFRALPSRNVSVRVVTSIPTVAHNSTDLQVLKENGIQIRRVNFGRLTKGILHTKFWIVDGKHIYIGSANMDWRALTQVKELGVVIYNSSGLAADLHKIFQSYWVMGRSNASIPDPWPSTYDTFINEERPLLLNLSGVASQVYITVVSLTYIIMDHKNKLIYGILEMPINLMRQRNKRQCFTSSSVYFYGITADQKRLLCKTSFISHLPQASPPAFCPDSRTRDLDAILSAIRGAQDFIHVSVMEYYPASKFFHHHGYWPVIEDALKRSAFERNVSVCLLVSCGQETDPSIWPFLRSLDALHSPSNNINIAVRLFIIPAGNQSHIPYTRVNHNKYMVTDKVAYVGTSNWSADYFNSTAGVGLVVSQDALPGNSFQQQLSAVFDRDWNSQFAVPLAELKQNHDCVFSKSTP